MDSKIIVITGGPGTGKTTIIEKLIENDFVCFPEVSREITMEAKKNGIDQLFLENPLLFSELLLEGRKKQFLEAKNKAKNPIFIDRGIPDVLAYMHFSGDSYPATFTKTCTEFIYNKVFILPPWEAIYESDEARYENFDQAKLIYKHIIETYQNFGYQLIEVPKGTVEERVAFILSHV